MTKEWTVGDIFEELAERVATARTRALMGERQEALALLQRAQMDYLRFREVLKSYPGNLALQRSLEAAQATLCEERAQDREEDLDRPIAEPGDDSSMAA
jgi:hypothetical protein